MFRNRLKILTISSYFFRVELGVDSLTTRADTVRLNYFPASDADVHIVLLDRATSGSADA